MRLSASVHGTAGGAERTAASARLEGPRGPMLRERRGGATARARQGRADRAREANRRANMAPNRARQPRLPGHARTYAPSHGPAR